MLKFKEQRKEPRERLALPLRIRDGRHAVTRNISSSGLFFEMAGEHDLFGLLDFEMQLPEHMKFSAVGEIVRVEYRFGTTGVAVKLLSPRLEPLD
ncbi:MAG TPA: PilZ domain-containing protein [Ramlibacter sp.]|nr:PilZ domain-containing protein [Ramlibacter sp.]